MEGSEGTLVAESELWFDNTELMIPSISPPAQEAKSSESVKAAIFEIKDDLRISNISLDKSNFITQEEAINEFYYHKTC